MLLLNVVAKEGTVSLGTYATQANIQWKNADFGGIGRLAGSFSFLLLAVWCKC